MKLIIAIINNDDCPAVLSELTHKGYGATKLSTSGGFLKAGNSTLLIAPPCFAAIGAMNAEIKDKKWLLGGIALQLGTGFTIGYLVYQIGTLITEGNVGTGFLPGVLIVGVIMGIVLYLCAEADKKVPVKK